MKHEEMAGELLKEWITNCRSKNPSSKVELKDVSNWEEKRFEINEECPDLNTIDGIFLLFCFGSLLSSGGGHYKGRVTELRNKYQSLLARKI